MKNKIRYLFADKENTLSKPLYLNTVGKVALAIGISATPIVSTYNVPVVSMYFTCASTNTGTSFQPVLINTIMTGAGQVGGRVRVNMESDVALGAWANAFKASVDWKTSGSVSGLGSAICAEMTMQGAAMHAAPGQYAVMELELVCPASWSGNNVVSLIYAETSGDTKANFDTYGYLFVLKGISEGNHKMFQTNTTVTGSTHSLRIQIGTTDYFIPLHATSVSD